MFLASGGGAGYTFQVGVLAILVEASGKEHSRVSSPEAFEVSSHRLVIPPWASGCGGEAVGQSQNRFPGGCSGSGTQLEKAAASQAATMIA